MKKKKKIGPELDELVIFFSFFFFFFLRENHGFKPGVYLVSSRRDWKIPVETRRRERGSCWIAVETPAPNFCVPQPNIKFSAPSLAVAFLLHSFSHFSPPFFPSSSIYPKSVFPSGAGLFLFSFEPHPPIVPFLSLLI